MKVFQVSVKEWVFVVPFDFKGNVSCFRPSDMVNLVAVRDGLFAIDYQAKIEIMFGPFHFVEPTP